MIPTDAPLLAFAAVLGAYALLPITAILLVAYRARAAWRERCDAEAADRRRQLELLQRLAATRARAPIGFVLHAGDEEQRPRGVVVIYEPAPSEDAAAVVRERAG